MNKTIVVTGATGFVGKKLCLKLFLEGYQLKILSRSKESAKKMISLPAEFIEWNGYSKLEPSIFEGSFGVIHLAGESVAAGRWSKKRKEKILNSRTITTKIICDTIKECSNPPKIMIGASAIGIYGNVDDKLLTESSPCGNGFLADVCLAWENSYQEFNGRLVMLRTGVVLGDGGALEKMILPFRLGGGGPLSNGNQWMSWIHIDDLVNMYTFSLENEYVSGAVNAVAPNPVRNTEFTKALANTVGMPAIIPVPGIMIKLIFGEMSSILLDSQKVSAEKILKLNFKFSFPLINSALDSLLRPEGKAGSHTFTSYQWLKNDKEEVFTFFSKAENLEIITPPWLNFKILKKSDNEIKQGTLIDYKLKIKGAPAYWRTLISNWSPPNFFTDSQLKGPYSIWEHTHRFISVQGGTLMTDEIIYKVPLGPIGHLLKTILIKNDVTKIFEYRNKKIKELF
jgi:uncharacterized protein (TIGR01777 family)